MITLNEADFDIHPDLLSLALNGYATYTTLKAVQYQGAWAVLGWEHHLNRLEKDSKHLFGMSLPHETITKHLLCYLEKQLPQTTLIVRLTIFPHHFSLAEPEKISELKILFSTRPSPNLSAEQPNLAPSPIRAKTIETARFLPMVKTTNLIPTLHAKIQARREGYDDALLTHNGFITEGSTWNIFFWNGEQLVTPALSCGLLAGITRSLLMKHLPTIGLTIKEQEITADEIHSFQQAFMSNAVVGLAPIGEINTHCFEPSSCLLKEVITLYQSLQPTVIS